MVIKCRPAADISRCRIKIRFAVFTSCNFVSFVVDDLRSQIETPNHYREGHEVTQRKAKILKRQCRTGSLFSIPKLWLACNAPGWWCIASRSRVRSGELTEIGNIGASLCPVLAMPMRAS